MLLERDDEKHLRERLEPFGFLVCKLVTPGRTGPMDRMILRPRYSPGAPFFLELKRKNGKVRPIQKAVALNWRQRGMQVLKPVFGREEVDAIADQLIALVMPDYAFATEDDIYDTPETVF